ncbi:MAG: 50S ribosomal protein L21 [Bdellovibrionales bacterium]|nr:50S ribosomal protein L21 [Bdellovibrionales bacterium]
MTKKTTQADSNASAEETQFAVIKTGGKQYRVVPGQVLPIELLSSGEESSGEESSGQNPAINFSEVLLVRSGDDIKVGTPLVAGASVKATIVGESKGDKVFAFKMRRRKGLRKKTGHRQKYTVVKIDEISA